MISELWGRFIRFLKPKYKTNVKIIAVDPSSCTVEVTKRPVFCLRTNKGPETSVVTATQDMFTAEDVGCKIKLTK